MGKRAQGLRAGVQQGERPCVLPWGLSFHPTVSEWTVRRAREAHVIAKCFNWGLIRWGGPGLPCTTVFVGLFKGHKNKHIRLGKKIRS